jgi:sialate O-acetylesterase
MKTTIMIILSVVCMGFSSAHAEQPLWLPAIFGDHMVLQQGKDLPVWGKAVANETVVVTVGGQTAETKAGADGKWIVRLKPMTVNQDPVELTVTSGSDMKTFKDVLVGDVWLASGQSNMGMGIAAMKGGKEIVAKADHPKLRLFQVERQVSFEKSEEVKGKWIICTPETLAPKGYGFGGFSAIGYYFGAALQQDKNIPVGMIGSYVGGTLIQSWSSLECLEQFNERGTDNAKQLLDFKRKKATLDQRKKEYDETIFPKYDKVFKAWKASETKKIEDWQAALTIAREKGEAIPKRPARAKLTVKRPIDPVQEFRLPTVLYNGMINPIIPYAIKGALWYQGEANCYPNRNTEYATVLPNMIKDWRSKWRQGDFPFFVVQLPNMNTSSPKKFGWWSTFRESQRLALNTPNTFMAVTIDVGDPNDLHPTVKKPIADRLVLAAKEHVYGDDVVGTSPLIKDAQLVDGKVSLSFTDIGSGLTIGKMDKDFNFSIAEGNPLHFELAGNDGKFVTAQAKIEGDTVIVWSDDLKDPTTVRYAWRNNPEPAVNLYNKQGLPASPFETNILKYLK